MRRRPAVNEVIIAHPAYSGAVGHAVGAFAVLSHADNPACEFVSITEWGVGLYFNEVTKVLDQIALIRHKPLAQIAINWSTQKSYVSTAICGVRDPQQARENCSDFEWELTAEEMDMIDQAVEYLRITDR